MPLILPNDIEPLTPADAAEVEQNYSFIEQYINTNVITRNGAVAMTSPLTLAGSPTQALHAATKAYVDALLPVGVIMPFGAGAAPEGNWLLCNGGSVSTVTYSKLFAVIGYSYGGSGGSFKVPDLRGRIPIGMNPTEARFNDTGKTGGTWVAPVPAHTHPMTHNHPSFNTGVQSANHTHEHPHTHPINHDHGSAKSSANGVHDHEGTYENTGQVGGAGFRIISYVAGAALHTNITESTGNHQHDINLPAFVGSSGGVNGADTTGAQSASHTHAADVPNFVGNTGSTGTAGVEHLPPFVVLSYIIRAA